MAWEVVAAALGGSLITGFFSYLATKQGTKSADQRTIRELEGRLAHLEREQKHDLLREAVKRRTDFRRERLIPVTGALGRLVLLSSRYRNAADDIFAMHYAGEPPSLPNADEEYQKVSEEIIRFRREQLESSWLGGASPKLVQLLDKLNGNLVALENAAREYAEYGGPTKNTRDRAEAASKELASTVLAINEEIEDLISGNDLLEARADGQDKRIA